MTELKDIKESYDPSWSFLGAATVRFCLKCKVRDKSNYLTASLVELLLAHSEPWQTSVMELFVFIAEGFRPLTKLTKPSS